MTESREAPEIIETANMCVILSEPGTDPSSLNAFIYLILTATLKDRYYNYPPLQMYKTEAQQDCSSNE